MFSYLQIVLCPSAGPGSAHFQTPLTATAEAIDNIALALPHNFHIDRDWPGLYAIVCPSTRQVSYATAGNHCFGRGAAFVDAGAPYMFAFDDGRLPSRLGQ